MHNWLSIKKFLNLYFCLSPFVFCDTEVLTNSLTVSAKGISFPPYLIVIWLIQPPQSPLDVYIPSSPCCRQAVILSHLAWRNRLRMGFLPWDASSTHSCQMDFLETLSSTCLHLPVKISLAHHVKPLMIWPWSAWPECWPHTYSLYKPALLFLALLVGPSCFSPLPCLEEYL